MQVGSSSFAAALPPPPESGRRTSPTDTASSGGGPLAPSTAAEPANASPLDAERDRLQEPSVRTQLNQLRNRDREVRAHEQAHTAAGGGLVTSGPSYSYQVGPDGRRYAIGGEVGIDTSPVRGDPEATIAKARQIRAAALAPADPSAQDLRVAAKAGQMERSAQIEIARREREAAAFATDGGLPSKTPPAGSLVSAVA